MHKVGLLPVPYFVHGLAEAADYSGVPTGRPRREDGGFCMRWTAEAVVATAEHGVMYDPSKTEATRRLLRRA